MNDKLNLLQWTIDKQSRDFRVYVVQPARYDPITHAEIFDACLRSLVGLDDSGFEPEPFDLLTFPEAFITANVLCSALSKSAELSLRGCVR